MHSLLRLENCQLCIKNTRIFSSINLVIPKHKISVLVGSNGVGKSMLMDMIAGTLSPNEGTISRGLLISEIGYLSQGLELPYLLTIQETIQYYARLLNPNLRKSCFQEMLKCFHPQVSDIAHKLKTKRASKCSFGEKKLLLINLFVAYSPFKLLIMDEPTAGLSPSSRSIYHELCDQVLMEGKSIFFSTHHMDDIKPSDIVINLDELNESKALVKSQRI